VIRRLREQASVSLAVLVTISFVSSLGISIMLPLLPLYGLSLGATPLQLGLVTSAFAVAQSAGQFGIGFFIDRYGSRRFILAGTGVYAVANGLIATAPTALALVAYRALAGLGAGGNLVSTQLYISQVARAENLAFFNSILAAARSAGSVLGPALGGFIAVASDLRAPFEIVAMTSTLAFVAAAFLPRSRGARHAATTGAPELSSWNRSVYILLTANLLLLVGFGSWITSYAPFATQKAGWTTFDVGIIFTIFGVGDITLGPWLGHLADRTGRRRMAVLAAFPIGAFGIAMILGAPRLAVYGISLFTGAALTAFNASWFALLATAVPASRRGRVFGVVSAVSNVGTVIGALGASALWQIADVGYGLLMGSLSAICAGLVLLLLPREVAPVLPRSERPKGDQRRT
jgi:MFS family permease